MRWRITIGLSCVGLLMSLSACQTPPKPCDCGQAVEELTRYTIMLHDAMEDRGNLRQQLKACQEAR